MLQRLVHVTLFLFALLGTASWVQSLDRMPFLGWSRSKCAHFLAHKNDYDTLIIGSSRLHHGCNPADLDLRTKELGLATRTYNLAFGGMRAHDFDEVANWVLDQRPANLRRMVIELTDSDPGSTEGNWMADMPIQTHTLRQFANRCGTILGWNQPLADKLAKLHFVTAHTLVNALRIGQGPRLVDDLLRTNQGRTLDLVSPVAAEGFVPVEQVKWAATFAAHEAYLANPEQAIATRDKKKVTKLLPQFHRGFSMSSWRRLDQRCRQLGIEPIYVVMPTMSWGFQGRDAVAELGDQAFVLDLDDPANHPTLFEIGLYYDPSHLNQEGSSFFSRYLAEQMVMRLAAKGPAPTKLK